ncbi:MAG: potassium-transporting ATPase subunit C [Clostridia bacterium]|nr:potassium-transporting ATPase subunit C [Deltaproteobacteria bacterium]
MLTVIVFTGLTGFVYPLAVTGFAQLAMHDDAEGDPDLLGRASETVDYFWSRPSATSPDPYNGAASSGSNLGPLSETLVANVQRRVDALCAANVALNLECGAPPVDLVTASASGLDPHISPEAAHYQAARIARARGVERQSVDDLIAAGTEGRTFGLFGAPRVNVSILNRALDVLAPKKAVGE